MNADIPDKIPGMTELPILMEQLLDILRRIAESCESSMEDHVDATKHAMAFVESLRDEYGEGWPPIAIFVTSIMLREFLSKFSIQIVIDHRED